MAAKKALWAKDTDQRTKESGPAETSGRFLFRRNHAAEKQERTMAKIRRKAKQ
jgi:hypothetical protein